MADERTDVDGGLQRVDPTQVSGDLYIRRAAVAGDAGGNPIINKILCLRISYLVSFEMRMHIYKAGCYDRLLGIDDLFGTDGLLPAIGRTVTINGLYPALVNGDRSVVPAIAGSVYNPTVRDEQIALRWGL